MTKRYLFVCGGTGKGLVSKRKLFGFDGFLQIDVTTETINVNDPLTNKMALPLPGDTIVTTTDALYAQVNEIELQIRRSNNHIVRLVEKNKDVIDEYERLVLEKAVVKKRYDYANTIKEDLSVSQLERDEARAVVSELQVELARLNDLEDQLSGEEIPYVQLKKSVQEKKAQQALFQNVAQQVAPVPIAVGMSQMPIIGSAYFNRQHVYEILSERINGMTQGAYAPKAGEDIEVWVVSSMCGGTGQGISHHVAKHIYKQLRNNNPTSGIFVNFIRIGAWTYGNIGGQRIKTNTAMAVLHDAALAYNQLGPANSKNGMGAVYQFYYMELPDVGENSELRQQDVELAVRSIVNAKLQVSFQREFTNIAKDWYKALFVRTGYWARDIDKDAIYRETLEQLRQSIQQFLTPNYIRVDSELRHEFTRSASLEAWSTAQLVELIKPQEVKNANMIRALNLPVMGTKFESMDEYLNSGQFQNDWDLFTNLLNRYIGLNDKGSFGGVLNLGPNDPTAVMTLVAFDAELSPKHSNSYIAEVRRAHETIARVNHLLAGGMIGGRPEPGFIKELYRIWNEMKSGDRKSVV